MLSGDLKQMLGLKIMGSEPRHRRVICLVIILSGLGYPVLAQERTDVRAKLYKMDKQARDLFQIGRQQDAIETWQKAEAMATGQEVGHIASSLAVAYEVMERPAEAWYAWRRATILDGEKGLRAKRKMRALQAELTTTHGRLLFAVKPDNARVQIQPKDGPKQVLPCPSVRWLKMGRYTILVGKKGSRTVRKDLQIIAGKDYPIRAELVEVEDTPPARVSLATGNETEPLSVHLDPDFGNHENSESIKGTLKWIAAGVGAGIAGLGAALHIAAVRNGHDDYGHSRAWRNAAYSLYGAGTGMAATGIVLFIIDAETSAPVTVSPVISRESAGAGITVGF